MGRETARAQHWQEADFLKTNMDAGHGGAAGRFDRLDEVAIAYVFAIVTVGADAAI